DYYCQVRDRSSYHWVF
nr:immunoglobulin light chain junction region [Macaca mulatta]